MSTTSNPISRSGYNGTGSVIPKGTPVSLKSSGKYREIVVTALATTPVYGIAAEDIKDGAYGLVYIMGTVPVLVNTTLTIGGGVTAVGGLGVAATTGNLIFGTAVEAGGTATVAEVELGIGVGRASA